MMEAAGYGVVLVETVGVGQSEILVTEARIIIIIIIIVIIIIAIYMYVRGGARGDGGRRPVGNPRHRGEDYYYNYYY